MNAATMLGQSKTAFQAEIDAACELTDFWRYNVSYMHRLMSEQPISSPGIWNRIEYRPLEGFVFAVSPFNFTAIAGNLPTAPALMGNTVVFKPASTAVYSAHFLMKIYEEAGLPPGVINMVLGSGREIGDPVLAHPDLAGIHFTGSTGVFQGMWKTVAQNIDSYRTYPRLVGETGGKDFIFAHPSADPAAVVTAVVRGGFEYQGQKCSAASRVYAPSNLWPEMREALAEQVVGDQDGRRARLPELHGRRDRQAVVHDPEGGGRAGDRRGRRQRRRRRRDRRLEGVVRVADRRRDVGSRLRPHAARAVRPRRHGLRLRREARRRHARSGRLDLAVRADRRRLRDRPARRSSTLPARSETPPATST